jgi:hypothetical protein
MEIILEGGRFNGEGLIVPDNTRQVSLDGVFYKIEDGKVIQQRQVFKYDAQATSDWQRRKAESVSQQIASRDKMLENEARTKAENASPPPMRGQGAGRKV